VFGDRAVETVLDCACGSGHDLRILSDLGYRPVGSDLSAAMLEQAKATRALLHPGVPLARADFRRLPFRSGALDAVICLRTSLPHLQDRNEVLTALRSIRGVIRSGGVLVLSQGITDRLMREQPKFILEVNTPEFSRIMALDYLEHQVRISVLDVFHTREQGDLKVASFEYSCLLTDDYRQLLRQAGFGDADYYGSWSMEPYDEASSPQLIIVASA
jgi:SAM-dependent methyltransferase